MNTCIVKCEYSDNEALISEVVHQKGELNTDVLRQFIETFETLPELWNSTHANYMNKMKRNIALDKLVRIYNKIKPGANRDDVRKKINTLRSNFRKELKKIAISKKSRCDKDEIYHPTSWVFYSLMFLYRCKQPVNANVQQKQTPYSEAFRSSIASQTDNTANTSEEQSLNLLSLAPSRSSINGSALPAKKQRVVGSITKQNELLSLTSKYLQESKQSENNCPTVAKVWGEKLISLDPLQRIFAEKAINDVLFEASLGNLHRHSIKINEDCHQSPSLQSFTSRISTPLSSPPDDV